MGALNRLMVYMGLRLDESELESVEEPYLAPVTKLHDVNQSRSRPSTHQHGGSVPTDLRTIRKVEPRSYNDARIIGEAFREGVPVIMNLTDMTDADAKRLVDFSAGLSFGLHGEIERVTTAVFLLSPAHIQIGDDNEPATERCFFNQS